MFGCKVHKNAFGGPTGGAIALRRPPSRYKGKGREEGKGKERVGNRQGRRGGKEGREEVGRDGKGRVTGR